MTTSTTATNIAGKTDAELVAAMNTAWEAGADAAKALKPGDVFTGAMPAATAAGYADQDSVERSAFISAYLANLARPVMTTQDGNVIVQIGDQKAEG